MIRKSTFIPVMLVMVIVFTAATSAISSADQTPASNATIAKSCAMCHQAKANILWGEFDNVAFKANTIQMKIDDTTVLLAFDEDDIKVVTTDGKNMDGGALHKAKRGQAIKVEYTESKGVKTAVRLVEKPVARVSPEMLFTLADLEKLISKGPKKGHYFLYDSRPEARYHEGAIPSAISLPYPAFDTMADKLPKDKHALIVFYSSGATCNMSPASAEKAQKMGYTNVKVFRDGIPAWSAKHYTVLSPQSFKSAWIDKGIPYVLLDARATKEASKGFIKGAVSFPASRAAKLIKNLPTDEVNPPIIIYDAKGSNQAEQAAAALVKAGYSNVNILSGGFAAWHAAKYEFGRGKMSSRASYIPQPRPGAINVNEFKKYAESLPSNVVIVDVRNLNEVQSGMLKVAKNIPLELLQSRAAEIPKDKLVITQCATGVRAEMAYHTLKALGYSTVKFLNAKIKFDKNGSYTIDED